MVSPALSWASLVLATEVRGDDHAWQFEQRRLGHGLGREHVNTGTGNHAVADAVSQIAFVDNAAAGHVNDAQRRLRLEQQVTIDETKRLRRLREVNRQEVRLGDHLIEGHQFDTHHLCPFF